MNEAALYFKKLLKLASIQIFVCIPFENERLSLESAYNKYGLLRSYFLFNIYFSRPFSSAMAFLFFGGITTYRNARINIIGPKIFGNSTHSGIEKLSAFCLR